MSFINREPITSAGALRDIVPENEEHDPYIPTEESMLKEEEILKGTKKTEEKKPMVELGKIDSKGHLDLLPKKVSGGYTWEEPIDHKDHNYFSEEGRCTSRFCTSGYFLMFVCFGVLIQSMVVTGLTSATLSTVERRFSIKSLTMGFILSFYDFVVLMFVNTISFYGGKGHTTRWIGIGFILIALGAFVYALPHFLSSEYEIKSSFVSLCLSSKDWVEDCSSASPIIVFFFIAQGLLALGAATLYSLGPSYLDLIVHKSRLTVYLGIFYAVSALGPAFGFGLAGIFLDTWVDPGNQPLGIVPEDREWVGAWWIGYVLASFLGIFAAVPLFFYPKFIPNTREIREENKRQTLLLARRLSNSTMVSKDVQEQLKILESGKDDEITIKDIPHPPFKETMKYLLTNKTYLFNSFGQAAEGFLTSGYAFFMSKIGESVFKISASQASFLFGSVVIPGAAGGIFFGGWFIKHIKASTELTARTIWKMTIVSGLLMGGILLGCDTIDIAGVNHPYQNTVGINGIINDCNKDCNCNPDVYDPICSNGNTVIFSGCHAGCTELIGEKHDENAMFQNCSCLGGLSAQNMKCDESCDALVPYMIVLFFTMFCTFVNNVPATSTSLRSISVQYRSVGMGFQNFIWRSFGTIPGPIVFGFLIDQYCILPAMSCGEEKGNCLEYESMDIRWVVFTLAVCAKSVSTLCFFTSWWYFKPAKGLEEEEEEFNRRSRDELKDKKANGEFEDERKSEERSQSSPVSSNEDVSKNITRRDSLKNRTEF